MYAFLSAEWVDAVRAIRDEYAPAVDAIAGHTGDPVAVNLLVTDLPDRGEDVRAHAALRADGSVVELGHVDDARILVTLDYRTARHAVVDQDIKAIIRGFVLGKISIKGDLAGVLTDAGAGTDGDPVALLSAFDVAGVKTIGDLDPTAQAIAERIRAVTL